MASSTPTTLPTSQSSTAAVADTSSTRPIHETKASTSSSSKSKKDFVKPIKGPIVDGLNFYQLAEKTEFFSMARCPMKEDHPNQKSLLQIAKNLTTMIAQFKELSGNIVESKLDLKHPCINETGATHGLLLCQFEAIHSAIVYSLINFDRIDKLNFNMSLLSDEWVMLKYGASAKWDFIESMSQTQPDSKFSKEFKGQLDKAQIRADTVKVKVVQITTLKEYYEQLLKMKQLLDASARIILNNPDLKKYGFMTDCMAIIGLINMFHYANLLNPIKRELKGTKVPF